MFRNLAKAFFSPRVDNIMASFHRVISLLEHSAEVNDDIATELEVKAEEHREEAQRADALAAKLRETFDI